MADILEFPVQTLRSVMRMPPMLEPQESLGRFAQLMRFEPMGMLPVVLHGRLLGVIAQTDLLAIFRDNSSEPREQTLERPVSEFMRAAPAVLHTDLDVRDIERLFAETGSPMLPVLDERGSYLGVVCANDLLVPDMPAPRPARIGGMATPFGVYLTDGTLQAGVGNLALMSSGAMMSLLMGAAYALIFGAITLFMRLFHTSFNVLALLGDDVQTRNPWLGLLSIVISTLMFVVFMLLMRTTRLAGYHAAEHQTVHAIERFEDLKSSIVRRMPRAHPRCGTNLLAAVSIFLTLKQALGYVPSLNGLVEIMAGIVTLFVWRPVGTFLQERFTTKPADDREIASGIAAGKALLEKYRAHAPVRPSFVRRVWCSGMIQVMAGSLPFWGILYNYDAIWRLITLRHF